MSPVVLKAHFDGREIKLDEPYALPADAKLMVMVLPTTGGDDFWRGLSKSYLSRAYGDDEPDYPPQHVAEPPAE